MVGVAVFLVVSHVVGVGDCHELVGQAKVQMALVQVPVPVVAGVIPGWVHLAPFAVDLYGVPGVAVAGDAAVGDARGVKELGVDALVALAGALVAREAAFGRAPVEAVVVLQLVERPVVEPKRHVVFRTVCLLPALGHGVVDDLRDAWAGGVVYGVDTESYDSWLAFLRAIRSRGAAGVRLVVSDAHPGLVRALGEVFQGAAWQRCAVHLMRDCTREAGSWQLRRRVGRIVSQVFRGRDAATVTAMYHAACDMLEGCCPRAAAVLEEAEPDALAYLDFPPTHWKRLRTNNVQERTNREIKRRSRVVQVFPSTGSLVRLAGAVMCEQDEIWQESRYFSEVRMNELYDDGRTRGIDGPVEWARLEAEARKMLESGLELADRVEAA